MLGSVAEAEDVVQEALRRPRGAVLDAPQRLIGVCALDVAGGQITSVSGIVNPDKLTQLGPVGDFTSLLSAIRPSGSSRA
jgi:hypothetical protein